MAGLYDYIAEGKVQRDEMPNCVEFIILEDNIFSSQGIGVLRNERHSGFIKCSRSIQDGYECVRYSVANSGFRPLRSVLGKIKADNFMQCLVNLKSIFDLSDFNVDDGYFNKNNVAVRFNDVYIDINSSRVYILYVPLVTLTSDNSCEKILAEEILSAVKSHGNLSNAVTSGLCELVRRNVPALQAIGEISHRYGLKPVNYELLKTVTVVSPEPGDIDYFQQSEEEKESDIRRDQIIRNERDYMNENDDPSLPRDNINPYEPYEPKVAPPQPNRGNDANVPERGKGADVTGTQVMYNTGLYLVSKKRRAEFPLNFGINTVGYNSDVDIDLVVFRNDTISHFHATICVGRDGKITVMDGVEGVKDHSKNGTAIVTQGFGGKNKIQKLVPQKKYSVGIGTCLMFANEEFTIMRK